MEPTRHEFLFQSGTLPKAIFYILTFLSIGIMMWQFAGRARFWMKGKKLTWRPDYISGIVTYILAQRKVMGSRPKDGAPLHLMIFYGFLSLFIATTLLAIATYGPLIGLPNWHRGSYYLAYETIFDALGLLFIVGVAWAYLRRRRLSAEQGEPTRDPVTGKLARSSNPITTEWKDFAALGLLFVLGITGYVLEGARIAANPQPWDHYSFVGYGLAQLMPGLSPTGYVAIWWFHMVVVWAFFIALPHMRLKHIVVATLTAAGDPKKPMGALPAVDMAAFADTGSMGAAEAKDYSRWHLMSLDACMSCGRCTEVCPAYGAGKILNPKQVVQDIHRTLTIGENVPATVSEDALWACTTCNACVEACPVLIRHVDLIVDARRNLVSEGRLSGSGSLVLKQIGGTGSAWGQAASSREEWMKGMDIPLCRDGESFDVLFWVGCAGAMDLAAVRTTKAMARLMQKAGIRFACLGEEESCTGDPARRIGDETTFVTQAEHNQKVFAKYGVTKIVTACPHCLNTLSNEYGDFGASLQVLHHTQLLDDLIAEGRLKPASLLPGSTTYHDPCYLARINNISDAPRRLVGQNGNHDDPTPLLLKSLAASEDETIFAEPEHHARKTLCCGAGGGRMWMEEEPNQRPGEKRAQELLATGAKEVAVSCPFCRIMLDASVKQANDEEINLVDLAELVERANS